MIVEEKFLNKKDREFYLSKAKKNTGMPWEERLVDLNLNDPIVLKAISFFKKFNYNLKIQQVQIQTWPVGSWSDLHLHGEKCDWDDGRENIRLNSLVYLNDDFLGGEFFTKNIILKPKKGMITLFDGSEVSHGVKKIEKKERYTVILWWRR
jgi:hypothetical protein